MLLPEISPLALLRLLTVTFTSFNGRVPECMMSRNGSYSLAAALSFTSFSSPGGVLRITRCHGDATHTAVPFCVQAGKIIINANANTIRFFIALSFTEDVLPCKDLVRVVSITFFIITLFY